MTTPPYIGRFAPSPTGPLHFGSLVAALASYLDARAAGGRWHLRIDDVDSGRSRAEYAAEIPRTLEGLGLHWDGPIQSQDNRREIYQTALEKLIAAEQAFPCSCTRRELEDARRGPAGVIYPGYCRNRLPPGRSARSWRFAVDDHTLGFRDRCAGQQTINPKDAIGDFIIRRADGLHAYHLAMVLDDAALGVTDVVRGADLLPATAPQILLQRALDLPTPGYLHIPVARDNEGRKLSKTNHAPAIDPHAANTLLCNALIHLQHPPPDELQKAPADELLAWAVSHWQPQRLSASMPV